MGPSLLSIQITPWSLRQEYNRTWATLPISQEEQREEPQEIPRLGQAAA